MGYERFGSYKVHECLGAGGMASVHRATIDIGGGVEREVALKRLLPQLAADKKFIEDFIREAKLAANLNHPNIVRILELGRSHGVYFIAMELVVGHSLLQLMKLAGPGRVSTPIGIVVAIFAELLDALDYATNAVDSEGEPMQLVHRDLSSSNLIITDDGHVKIIDFGVAKGLSGKFMTNTGMVKGKLSYMASETMSGTQLDTRADIFSIGVVMWEMITGRRLFRGQNEYEVITRIRAGAAEPPSTYNAACTPELACMYDPAARSYKQCTKPVEGVCQAWGPACAPASKCMFDPTDNLHRECADVSNGSCKRFGALCTP